MANPQPRSFSLTSDPLIDGMTNGYYWLLDTSKIVDYSISNGFLGEFWYAPNTVAIYMGAALNTVSVYANINFNYIGYFVNPIGAVAAGSEINLSLSQTGSFFSNNNEWAFGNFPNSSLNLSKYDGAPGDIYLNLSSPGASLPSYEPGSQGWFLLMHELMHTLGLKHPHDDGGTGRPTFTDLGISSLNVDWASVMSYSDDASWNNFSWDPATPMALDVLALQYLYGKNTSYNLSNNTYQLTEKNLYYTLWDAGGNDSLDASGGSTGWTITLPNATLTNLVDTKVGVALPTNESPSLGVTPHTLVWLMGDYENVVGSQYADLITGNFFDNLLTGGGGADTIYGEAGNDTLSGGDGNDVMYGGVGNDLFDWDSSSRAGNDTMYGGAGGDTYVLDSSNDTVIESAGEGTDLIWTNLTYSLNLLTNVENLSLFGTSNINAVGNNSNNVLTGNSGNNILTGGGGIDTFVFASTGNGIDTISDLSVGDVIQITGAGLSTSATVGNGSSLGLNQIQSSIAGNITTLYIGTNSIYGADVQISLNGKYGNDQFLAVGQNIVVGTHTNTLPTGSVTITGTATQGQTLTAANTLADIDGLGTISYQWKADGTNISGATSSTLTLGQAQVGKAISVVASIQIY